MLPVFQAAMRIVDEQQYVSWALPKGSTVILSTNPDNSEYQVTSQDEAMKTRYLQFKMKPSVDDWARDFADKVKLDERCVNFLLRHPEVIENATIKDEKGNSNTFTGNLRLWTKFFDAISGIGDLAEAKFEQRNMLFMLGQNSLPEEHLILFEKFVNDRLDKLPTLDSLLKGSEMSRKAALQNLEGFVGTGTSRRNDLAAVMSKRLLNNALNHHEEYTPDMVEAYFDILESGHLSKDLVSITVKKVNLFWGKQILKRNKLKDQLMSLAS